MCVCVGGGGGGGGNAVARQLASPVVRIHSVEMPGS